MEYLINSKSFIFGKQFHEDHDEMTHLINKYDDIFHNEFSSTYYGPQLQMEVLDNSSIPSSQQVINSISSSSVFSEIALKNGFRQLELDPHISHLTAFDTDFGRNEWVVTENNSKNCQLYLQSIVREVLLTELEEGSFVNYLGRILLFSKNIGEHFKLLKKTFYCLQNYNLKVDNTQSSFIFAEINYLGYHIDQDGILISWQNYNKILNFRQPQNKHDLRSFLGLISFYKQFVNQNDYNNCFGRLNNFLRNYDFYWGESENYDFLELKNLFRNQQKIRFGNL